ncbi:MAG: hypothetical protein BGO92_07010 [Magnetospirillum sp. 64-120]|nr:MAG: hypothetical protein BGO92_07010 [Magnetospirillum sp. 64-120]
MITQPDWTERASRYLKAELKRQGVTYDDLAARLNAIGFQETKASISNKISRGAFTAAFFLAALHVAGAQVVRIDDA